MFSIYYLLLLTMGLNLKFAHNLEFVDIVYDNELSELQISRLNKLADADHFRETLHKILIPRIVGSEGHKRVRECIVKSMKDLNWQIDLDIFEDNTPNFGKLEFQNIIATQNPTAKRFLILACHYDSKYMADYEFLGATDSAVPCAMLINLAKTLNNVFNKSEKPDISLMFVFFDGEEAFSNWSATDSLYGSRHLAKKWNSNNFLKKINMLFLLDLLGAPDPKFYSFFGKTEAWYSKLITAEEKLAKNDLLDNYTVSGVVRLNPQKYFQSQATTAFIDDDHVPFMKLGVPVLHLIPVPFPNVWHTANDNLEVVDFLTVENLSKILRIFVVEYLKINVENI